MGAILHRYATDCQGMFWRMPVISISISGLCKGSVDLARLQL